MQPHFAVERVSRLPLRTIGCLLLFQSALINAQGALSQGPVPAVAAQSQPAVVPATPIPFAMAIKKAVAHLQTDCVEDGKTVSYSSTGFFVFKADERLGKDHGFGYLVTNRHAAQPGIEHGNPCRVSNYWIRVNLRATTPDGLSQGTTAALGPNLPWFFPDDPSVDLAIVPLMPNESKVDFQFIPTSMFATEEIVKKNTISEGDPVIFSGLFVQMPGLLKLEPIVRQGIIAMMPDEPIMTTLGKPGSLYLADVHVFGGNSGSPMFVNLGGFRNGGMIGGQNYALLGVVSGYEFEDTDFNLQAATTYSGKLGANSGVASVVPAKELDALINSTKLRALRDEAVRQALK